MKLDDDHELRVLMERAVRRFPVVSLVVMSPRLPALLGQLRAGIQDAQAAGRPADELRIFALQLIGHLSMAAGSPRLREVLRRGLDAVELVTPPEAAETDH